MLEPESRTELTKIAQLRLYPSITNPNYLVLRRRRLIFGQWMDRLGDELTVLDVGGRYQPYRLLLGARARKYVAVDVMKTAIVDVIGQGEHLPFPDETFDLVISTSVFDYLPEPRVVAAEIHRVLKPGGHLMMCVASMFPRIDDQEHWRFLPAGLRFTLAPFAKVEIVPEVTSIGGFLRMTAFCLGIFAKYSWVRAALNYTVVPMLNLIGLALERLKLSSNDQAAGNYSALAQK